MRLSPTYLFPLAVAALAASGSAEAQCNLSLPCDNVVFSNSTAFAITNNGPGRAIEGRAYGPGRAIEGRATSGIGVIGIGDSRGVVGTQGALSCAGSYGVGGCAQSGDGVLGRSRDGFAGRFEGRVLVRSLEITGGSDLAEPFDVADSETIKPGMLVSIDPKRTGGLRVSNKPYDRTVAGVVSGANGLNPAITLRTQDTPPEKLLPVALTGRVYCWADTSNGSIEPGDLLTTAGTPGYAMKVTDHAKAQGAIIGKAMSSLETGTGQVLALVGLQ